MGGGVPRGNNDRRLIPAQRLRIILSYPSALVVRFAKIVFGIDVSLQKARTSVFMSSQYGDAALHSGSDP